MQKTILTKINSQNAKNALERIGCDKMGLKIMGQKLHNLHFEVSGLSHIAAAILKQEALSLGAEFATPREQILYKGEKIGLLFGTQSQLKKLSKKLKMQDFGLKYFSKLLDSQLHFQNHKNAKKHTAQIMAIVNATPDSFYENSRTQGTQAIQKIYDLLEQKISLIDIGAASTRPGSPMLDSETEIARLKEICAEIKSQNLDNFAQFSIDTYNAKTALFALQSGFKIINDVSGFADSQMLRICADFGATAVLMHSRGQPENMQYLTHYENIFDQIDEFFESKICTLKSSGVKEIILDIGFGFAKTHFQNLQLIAQLGHFKHFGLPILIGASRKSTIGQITSRQTSDRLAGTLALHFAALQNGADILRAHDVSEHLDLLKTHIALSSV